ncbi:unnamed protein product [Acanthoscelides obtectus]|uniref:GOLD domain-containing protein n=1 Tax=Acanthoscelides obtectus TaxID=200917 RepID=A0A9P0PKY6_ACAOB|nr:unnamed protein product [Acanthoscelides obtectus]CAK1630405.1 Transmembrane emp24 domain-containing protein 6 [Acanthoscelides obtectus]
MERYATLLFALSAHILLSDFVKPIYAQQPPDHQPIQHQQQLPSQQVPVQHQQMPPQHQVPLQHQEVQHQQVPVQHQQVPIQHQQVPVQHQQVPVQHQQVPVQHQQVPVQHQQVPVQHQQVPVQHQQGPPQMPQMHYQQELPPQHMQQQIPMTTVPWYENLPAVAMDYKVYIEPGKEDCYFQYVNPGATFYVSFQVVRGGDGMAGFAVRHPSGQIVHPYQWKPSSEYQDQTSTGGYYSVCIDNQFSRFAGKLVNIYMTVVRYDMWDKFTQEVEELNMNMENFTHTIVTVEKNINDMLQYQYHSRARESWDYNLLQDNNTYVVRWSLIQIMIIVVTTAIQVYFVRKLFDIKVGSGGGKTRI